MRRKHEARLVEENLFYDFVGMMRQLCLRHGDLAFDASR